MQAPSHRLLWTGLSTLALSPLAGAQGKIDQALMMKYGGVLAPDCSNYMLPQLKYLGDSLVVQDGGKVLLTGRNPKADPKHFGAKPPPEFENALVSQVAGGDALVFVMYRNATGVFAAVEGGPKTLAALPAAFQDGKRSRHCDPNRNRVPGTAAPAELGPPVKGHQVAGISYQLVNVCKNHDCADNNLTLLYAPGTQAVYARLLVRGQPALVGSPNPVVTAELERLWKAEWRQKR